MSAVDLHVHSSFSSDGEVSPEKLIAMAKQRGLSMISIADHNNVGGVKAVAASGNISGIKVLPGIEVDCYFNALNLHILGYGINITDPVFADIEQNALKQEKEALPLLIRKLQSIGFHVTEEAVRRQSPNPIPVEEDIAVVLLQSPTHLDDPRLAVYRPGAGKSDMPNVHFYYDYCTRGKPAHVEKAWPDLSDVVRAVKGAGGIPVLAHPGASLCTSSSEWRQAISLILESGVEGIECFSSYHNRKETDFFLEIAKKHGKLITCGSDFHGRHKPAIILGATDCRDMETDIQRSFESLILE